MPLLDKQNTGTVPAGKPSNELKGEARKKANEKALKERRKAEKLELCKFIKSSGVKIPENIASIIHDWENPRAGGGGNFGEPLFNKIYGPTPKVGDSVTLQEVFNRTFKGVDKMNELMKKWKEKETAVVEYVHNATTPLLSQYIIKSIG